MIRWWWPYWWWTYCAACDLAAIRAGSYLARCAGCAREVRRG